METFNIEKSKLINNVKEFAIKKHDAPEPQRYGTAPYSFHLNGVVEVALRYIHLVPEADRENVIAACYAHDICEDTDITPSKLQKMFNKEVAWIVYRVTNEFGWTRKEKNFKTYPKIWPCDKAIFVKLCDRIFNTGYSKSGVDKESARKYKTYTEEYIIFRASLKTRDLYPEMWRELDSLNTY
ncbi:MAG: hypothetical protein WC979_02095 [Candidatus Pacearchaeota archaeon]|jgi:(p)ppGpp synthase/HD superfamily hydrolase|nr:hypothetical protein [Clostridia bacterium]